ncbi:MAG: arginine--tRNA ligase [Rickettsiales bacterium]|nr:arginine--tRNA ligase [Rickettsiales bacterium]
MNLFQQLQQQVREAVTVLAVENEWPAGLPIEAVTVELPRNPDHGDVATNAAMVLAKPTGSNPRAIAEQLKTKIEKIEGCEAVEIAGPGFINLRFAPSFWQQLLPAILSQGLEYGDSALGVGKKVNVEYVSANPTGPLHIGHARGAVVGDALAGLMQKAGYEVTREYYVNDAGSQIDTLARSAHLRYREALGEEIGDIPEGFYPGDYVIPVGQELAEQFGDRLLTEPEEKWMPKVKRISVEKMLDLIRADLALLNIKQDVFSSEKAISDAGKVEEVLQRLKDEDLVYVGVLEAPKGKEPDDWEPRPQTLFKSTKFGDDVDRALKKSDGSWTYFAPDIAYHYDKIQRGHDILIDIFGADHGGYVKRISAAVDALSGGRSTISVKLCQMVRFMRGGEPVQMSKRSGSFITVREVVEEVGRDALRFIMLTRKNDAMLDFDMDKAVEQSRDNPVFYVQYAHARCRSVLRMAQEQNPEAYALSQKGSDDLLSVLTDKAELALIRKMAYWPVLVEQAAVSSEPHRIAFYLQEMAAEFHGFWNLGNENENLRFLTSNEKLSAARIILVEAVANVIASGLNVLGVEAKEEMR